ncbi:uncharacterized protein [Elaeis guineensis]|uniref:Uncharacterized protein LOC114914509 n=1 Tax=Elaeis guineensis var. tenera TaxID=51953 RepID=A0A8N4F8D3_ELAGV|nr:uncharacterized protein LOC114914509 [Elaeis guineensis]
MLTLCKTTIHTLLDFSNHSTECQNPPYCCRNIPSPDVDGLRLLIGDTSKLPNIVKSSVVGPAGKPPHRTDLGTRDLHDLDHSNLRLCTKNLSSESCEDGRIGIKEIGGRMPEEDDRRPEARPWGRRRRPRWWRVEAKFLLPLLWLVGWDGRWSQFMHVVWEDSWIMLTKFRIKQPKLLRASCREERRRGRGMK